MQATLKIGEVARAADCPVETIRYYEREGLLAPAVRSSGNYRLYGPAHIEALCFIRHCRSLDMSHDEIRTLLEFRNAPDANCRDVNVLLDEHIGHVALRLRELRALERELKSLRGKCRAVQAARDCGIMQSLGSNPGSKVKAADGHRKLHRTHGS